MIIISHLFCIVFFLLSLPKVTSDIMLAHANGMLLNSAKISLCIIINL